MMNDFMRDKWSRLRVAPIIWLMHVADVLATMRVFLRVVFRASFGLWLMLLGAWWWRFIGSAAMYDTEQGYGQPSFAPRRRSPCMEFATPSPYGKRPGMFCRACF